MFASKFRNRAALLSGAIGLTAMASTAHAGATAACVAGTTAQSLECGVGSVTGTGAATNGTAVGNNAAATGGFAVATGDNTVASGLASTSVGSFATASNSFSTAVGELAFASGANSSALGSNSSATASGANAIGTLANATGANSTALGLGAQSSGAGSAALGAGSNDGGAANVVAVGSTTQTRRIINVTAGTAPTDAANVGQVNAVSTLVSNEASTRAAADTALGNRISALEALSQTSVLAAAKAYTDTQVAAVRFDLDSLRTEARRGIASAMAMSSAPFPSAPGKVSYSANTAIFRGEVAGSASVSYRLNTASPMAISGAISYSGGNNIGGRVGIAGEF